MTEQHGLDVGAGAHHDEHDVHPAPRNTPAHGSGASRALRVALLSRSPAGLPCQVGLGVDQLRAERHQVFRLGPRAVPE